MISTVLKQRVLGDKIFLQYENGDVKAYPLIFLGCEWFKMSNNAFYEKYGFNLNPCEIPGLYDKCRRIVYGEET